MGIYAYECPGCGEVEIEHSMNEDREEQACPICGVDVEPLICDVQLSATAEFRRYHLENGNLSKVESHENFVVENGRRGVWIDSKRQEKEILDKMGCRFGEVGDKLSGGTKIGDKPDKKIHIRR